ncbi:hypothetical protein ACIPVB_01830 [Microbacterium sp. NPDC090007]|uniref:hypothetical protein n=1 Tax=Microbacterium sp. NPDC090007 TaxID=3364204 RepID=UPI00381C611D
MPSETDGVEKIANLLALLLIKDMNKSTAASTLATSGFSNREIAGLLSTSEGSVRALLSASRKKTEKVDRSEAATDG